ncbi:GspH/FimT family protein [Candidatus Thiothrix sp. Deng01]|uniref:Type II secretion system protein H n=1 Tax=Candidatus Thiothrix phosphatis TaxID=3112415 RepID=A0ABU6D1I6_9GAMM|nr:GspH/FimT family protein [Candidatus Thiothrix sp. Deng01]MEB4592538.1 GspH/FimT family protein [Candidatus Thiothrix sp. Deng01]
MSKPKQTGMTLIELIVTFSIVAILAAVAAPSLSEMISNNRLTALNNQIVSTLNYMRGEAAKRAYDVTMCVRNASGTGCSTNTADGFENGWIVFTNCNPTTNSTPDTTTNVCDYNGDNIAEAPEEILLDTTMTLVGVTISNNLSTPQRINYRPNGIASNAGTLNLQLNGESRYAITIAPLTGRLSSCKVGTSGC